MTIEKHYLLSPLGMPHFNPVADTVQNPPAMPPYRLLRGRDTRKVRFSAEAVDLSQTRRVIHLQNAMRPTIRVEIERGIAAEEWGDLVANSSQATPFHLRSWIIAWSKTFKERPLYLVARDRTRKVLAGMPLLESRDERGLLSAYHSLPWNCYGSAILRDGADPFASEKVIDSFQKLIQQWNVSRAVVVDFHNMAPTLSKYPTKCVPVVAHVLPLTAPLESIEANYDHSIRKNLRTAARNGVVVRDATSHEDVDLYYELTQAVADKYKRPPYPRELFHNIFQEMVPRGEAKLPLAFRGDDPLSGAIHVMTQSHVFNWLTASNPKHLEYRPNEAVISSMIRWAVQRGSTVYNLGASPADAEGLIRFKEKWGAKKHAYTIYEIDANSRLGLGGKAIRRVRAFLRENLGV
jgi:CelD/BcsL family acetyltransferase involved in cellulose biosynthesis